MSSYNQLKLDFGESAEAEKAIETRIRAERAREFESAAVRLGMRVTELGYKLAGMLAVFVDSPSMRAIGVTGLKWTGTLHELASHERLQCSIASVAKALRRFEEAGMITRTTTYDDRGKADGILVELNILAIRGESGIGFQPVVNNAPQAGSLCHVGRASKPVASVSKQTGFQARTTVDYGVESGVGSDPVAYPLLDPLADPLLSSSLCIPSLPYIPKEPLLRGKTEKQPNHDSESRATLNSQNHAAADLDFSIVIQTLHRSGVERINSIVREAKNQGLTPADMLAIIATWELNRHRFTRPGGALMDRIRSGDWPVSIQSVDDVCAQRERARQRDREQQRRRVECELASEWKRLGIWATKSDAEINAEIDRRIVARLSES